MCSGNPSKRPDCQELLKTINESRVNRKEFDQIKEHAEHFVFTPFNLIPKIYSKLILKYSNEIEIINEYVITRVLNSSPFSNLMKNSLKK